MKARSSCDAAIAGALGAAAALCGKFAFDGRAARALMVRAAAAAGLAGATVVSESVFARALASADSSLVPTVVSVSTNFILSVCFLSVCTHMFFFSFSIHSCGSKKGLVGIVVLGERVELLQWSAGAALIALGLWLLATPAPAKSEGKSA